MYEDYLHEMRTSIVIPSSENPEDLFYFCTAADEKYFDHLLNVIASIHRHNFKQLGQIAVFDLGLHPTQLRILSTIQKVGVYSIEQTNPDILKIFNAQPEGKFVPGWYSWKPVAIKQAFDIFPKNSCFLWIDAGTTVLRDISDLFFYIKQQGYFFHNGWDWPIKRQATKFVIDGLTINSCQLQWLLADDIYSIEAGLMGFSQKIYDAIVLPVYELTKDIRYFADDGTAPEGFGYARHDQTLFSIYVHINNLFIVHHFERPRENFFLVANQFKIPFHIASITQWLTPETFIYCSRGDLTNYAENKAYIHYKSIYERIKEILSSLLVRAKSSFKT